MPSGADIQIDRLVLTLRLRGERERLEPVERRMRGLAALRLQAALARVELGEDAGAGDEPYVFIDRLRIDCGANTAWDDEAIAEHIARRVALGLHARLAQDGVLRFRDRADFVAAYLLARADGQAERRWCFDEFEGLARLSTSTALRTLLINEGEWGVAAAQRLTAGGLDQVLAALGDGDAARLLAAWQRRSATAAPLPALWRAACELPRDATARPWLRALLGMERAAPGTLGGGSVAALHALLRLRALAEDGRLALPDAARGWRPWFATTLATWQLDLQWLPAAADDELAALGAALAGRVQRASDRQGRVLWLSTPQGGLFLLLLRLERLGWLRIWRAAAARMVSASAALPTAQAAPAQSEVEPPSPDALARSLALCVCAVALAGREARPVLVDGAIQAVADGDDALAVLAEAQCLARRALRTTRPQVDAPGQAQATPGSQAFAFFMAGDAAAMAGTHAGGAQRQAALALAEDARTLPFGRGLRLLLGQAAAALLADFARTVPGLAQASPGYLRSQALKLAGVVEVAPAPADPSTSKESPAAPLRVHLGRAPLDVLLVLCGAKRGSVQIPGGPRLELREDHGA